MAQYTFHVEMSCGGCSGAVTKALSKLEGVDKFDVSLENQSATVESSTLSESQVLEAIQKTGKIVRVSDATREP